MKVYVPGLVAGMTRSPCWLDKGTRTTCVFGIPFDGYWQDVPDYFNQVTHGLPINDVIHAKLVDDWELNYSVTDGVAAELKRPDKRFTFRNTFVCASSLTDRKWRYLDISRATYQKEFTYSYGKHAVKTHVERVLTPFCADIGINRSGDGWHCSLYVCVPATVSPSESVNERQKAFNYKRASLDIRWDGHDEQLTKLDPPLYSIAEDVRSILISNFKKTDYTRILTSIAKLLEREVLSFYYNIINYYSNPYGFLALYTTLPDDFPELDLKSQFILAEPEVIGEHLDPLLVTKPFANYWRNYLSQHAILEACNSLPRLSDNSISNLIEVVGFLKSLIVDRQIEIPKSLADAWLAYRYQYGTGKQDIQDAIKFVHRHMDLGTLDRLIVGRGISTHLVDGTEVVCRCQVGAEPKHLSVIKDLWMKLDQYGLTPDFYAIWDMIPYSFMVDWFLPISDIASVWDANAMYFSGEFYTLTDLCISFAYTRKEQGQNVSCYTRYAAVMPSELNDVYWIDAPSASSSTWGRRVLDAASIFIGK